MTIQNHFDLFDAILMGFMGFIEFHIISFMIIFSNKSPFYCPSGESMKDIQLMADVVDLDKNYKK